MPAHQLLPLPAADRCQLQLLHMPVVVHSCHQACRYFGLQTGWVTMGSLQSAILGFGIFKFLQTFGVCKNFTVEENVIVQVSHP